MYKDEDPNLLPQDPWLKLIMAITKLTPVMIWEGGDGWISGPLLSSLSSQTDKLQSDLRETLSQKLRWLKKIPDIDFWAPHVHTCNGEHNHIFMCIPTPLT